MAAARGGSTRPAKSSGKQHRPIKRGRWHPITAIQRPWQAMPLRTRLTLMTTGLLAIGLIVVSFVVTSLLYSHMMGQIDSQLRTTSVAIGSQGLAQIREGGTSSTTFPSNYYVKAEYFDPSRNGEWISADTAAVYGRPQIKGLDYRRALAHADKNDFPITTVNSDQPGHQWRMITLLIKDQNTGQYTGAVALALPLSDVMETVERTRLVVALADVSIISVGAVFATYLVHRSFRSLRQIEGVAGRIAHGDLSARILVTEPRTTEVGSLQRAINAMLAQNETSFAAQVVAQERMTRFVSDASHELRTPLTVILGYSDMLSRWGREDKDILAEGITAIRSEAENMQQLIEKLLFLARADQKRQAVHKEAVLLSEILADTMEKMQMVTSSHEVVLDRNDEAVVSADPVLLRQLFRVFLENSRKYTPAGGHIRASSILAEDGKSVMVTLSDDGIGIAPEHQAHIFERFYRVDSSRTKETGGSGLGLSIARWIAEQHDIRIVVKSAEGQGTSISLVMPTLRS